MTAALYQKSARTFGGTGAPHRPVHTLQPSTCGECGHIIGWKADSDPIHAVPGTCGCGATLAPFVYRCDKCIAAADERATAERLARLAGYAPEPVVADDGGEDEDKREERRGENPDYLAAKQYAARYEGNFTFMLDMKLRVTGPRRVKGPLTPGQVAAVLRCKTSDEERAARTVTRTEERVRNQTGRDLTALPVGRTYAAVDNDSGSVTFLILDRPAAGSKWSGWVFVKQQVGGEETRLGAQRPGETYVGQWANLIDKVLADPTAAVARYGLELGICGVCARVLTNEESRELGIGPVCRAKLEGGYR